MNTMSKKLYVGVFSASLGLLLFFGILMAIAAALQNFVWYQEAPGLGIQAIAILSILALIQFFIVQLIFSFVILWKMWSCIQDGHARTTPGKAIGFLFIPFFNVYWIFQVWAGFPRDYNSFVERYRLPIPYLSLGVFTAYPIFILLTAIPFLGILIALINMFLFAAIVAKTCDAVNALAQEVQSSSFSLPVSKPQPEG